MGKNISCKVISLLLIICLAMVPAPTNAARAAEESEYVKLNGLYWGIKRNLNQISWFPREWDGSYFPTEIDGMKVKSIGEYSCTSHQEIRELVIPDFLTEIPEGAFEGCRYLTKVTIPASIKKIGDYAFESCDELETVIYKGKKKDIKFGNYAFADTYMSHPDFSDAYKQGIYYKQLHEVKLTGDFSDDILAIAKSQVGYHHGNDESQMHGYNELGGEYYAEYNYFTGSPDWQWLMKGLVKQEDYKWGYGGWCGNFCDWCMSMAGIAKESASYYGQKNSVEWKDTVYAGGSYKIKAGDVLHFSAGHYCLVESVKVDGNKVKINTLNGNPNVEWKVYTLNKSDGKNEESHNYDLREVFPLDESAASSVNSYTVSFDADGGSGDVSSKKVYEGGFFGILPKPTKKGYRFDGWYTEKNGGGKKITSYRNVRTGGDIKLYANWVEGKEPEYLDKDSYKSAPPEHSTIMDQFAGVYITKDTFSYSALQKKAQKAVIKKRNGKGKTTYKNVTEGSKKKYIKISKKGVVTIKKGAPK
ncbi:MAG: InlB B-repeat-containing protein [Lachnospiraceae bacterium]|nr:InlB B-repeat-containing protein [Lachnospiraceae bacterium]